AIVESRMSCTFGSGGAKLFKRRNMRCNYDGSVPNKPSRCQRNSDPVAIAKRSRYAICAASPVVVSVAVSQTNRRKTRQRNPRYFICTESLLCPMQISIKLAPFVMLSEAKHLWLLLIAGGTPE